MISKKLQNIFNGLATEIEILEFEGNYGVMAMGAKMELRCVCNKLYKMGYSTNSINKQIKLIYKSIGINSKNVQNSSNCNFIRQHFCSWLRSPRYTKVNFANTQNIIGNI